jgi:hypothetical protein
LRLPLLGIAALFVAAPLIMAPAAAAHGITVTACDTIRIDGQLYPLVTFQVHNEDPTRIGCKVTLLPHANTTPEGNRCGIVQMIDPPGWAVHVNQGWVWTVDSEEMCLWPGDSQACFQVALNSSTCCFDAHLSTATNETFGHETVCLTCNHPSPVVPSTWGGIKATYR